MAFEHTKFAFSAGYDDHMDVFGADLFSGRYEFEVEWHQPYASSAISAAFFTTSSMPPTM